MACSSSPPASTPRAQDRTGSVLTLRQLPPALDGVADGENDGDRHAVGALARAAGARFVALEAPPDTAHPVVCDIVAHRGALYVSHATDVIDRTGARVHRYDPSVAAGARWSLAFDYDGDGRGGQGLPRVRAIDGRLFAVDGDSTSRGFFGLTRAWCETYLFVSDRAGVFEPVNGDSAPRATRAAPFALHLFDVIEYGGAVITSGGSGLSERRAGRRSWPAALWVGNPQDTELAPRYVVGNGYGVVRTTFMHRFGGRLYVGFQNNERRMRKDLAILGGDPRDDSTPEPILARVTEDGGWLTRRFASGDGARYWVASGYNRKGDRRPGTLFSSTDGATFEALGLPAGAGSVQDVVVASGALFVLAQNGLYRGTPGDLELLASAPDGDPFGYFEGFCSAPLVAFDGELIAGSTRDGRLWRIEPSPSSGATAQSR